MRTGYSKQAGSILLAVLLGVSGAMGTGCMAFAEEETEAVSAQTELETAPEADTEADAEIVITELEITLGEETLTVSNATGIVVESAAAEATEDADSEAADENDAETALVFAAEDGTVHTFEIENAAELTALADLTLTEKIGFFFLYGTDADGNVKNYYETADEITLEASVTMYTTGQVIVRESADGSSEALGYVDRGSELEVLGGTSAWFLISQDDLTGYVAARYLTADEDEALAAVEAEENAQAAAAAAQEAAAAAAAAAAQAAASAAAQEAAAAAAAQAAAAASTDDSSSSSETSSTDNACLTGGVLN
ncbi:MAG: SH3 domain-containing protein [Lachnospiraceae bacterium]|nr:SH3 domain-containing protein [Lachnospiraceae bacterium]